MSTDLPHDEDNAETEIILEAHPDFKSEDDIGPSPPKKRQISKNNRKSRTPDHDVFTTNSEGLISVCNASSNPESRKRKDLRKTIDTVGSSAALEAQKKEQERLKRLESIRSKTPTAESYMPVPVYDISDDSEEDDDMPECLGIYKSQLPQSQNTFSNSDQGGNYKGYPYRVVPPIPPIPWANSCGMYSGLQPPDVKWPAAAPSLPSTSAPYVDSHTRNVNQAHAAEAGRVRRQKGRYKNFESTELTEGRLLVNQDHPEEDPDVYVAAHLTTILKPHQLGGIRFMYDNIIESVKDYEKSPGFGCVLAHSMGLGKTLQIISFVDIFFRTVRDKHVLIITPVNVIQNWMAEFNRWLPLKGTDDSRIRNFHVFLLGDTVKTYEDRRDMILAWKRDGGVLLMGYDMFRIFIKTKTGKQTKTCSESKKVLNRGGVSLSEEAESKRAQECQQLRKALVDPGPDLIVCDEGHKIKCLKTSISEALSQVRTRRRIVLTGYPLQNNLIEYFCMVDFVRPNYLGTKREFSSMFDRPIRNGQCLDSTPGDKKIAEMRIHGLKNMLKGFVQRRTAHLLKKILPENREYVIVVRKTPIQHALYREFVQYTRVDMYSQKTKYYNPLKAHAIGTKIWNHPDLLYYAYTKQINGFQAGCSSSQTNLVSAADKMRIFQTSLDDYLKIYPTVPLKSSSNNEVFDVSDDDDDIGSEISYMWAGPTLENYELMKIEHSNKIIVALDLIKETIAKGEKMLLFSASILTLNLIEKVLTTMNLEMKDANDQEVKWIRDSTFCRFDGRTPGIEREKIINKFNNSPKLHLFLISTRAGSLGINLVSANRVIIFDASWNPCHDAQAVCRVYRYGQQKKTYVYRLIMHNSMERAIFYRQISKHGLQKKVVDELSIKAQVTKNQLEDLLKYDEAEDVKTKKLNSNEWDIEDSVLKSVSSKLVDLIAEAPFLHESMIIESEEQLSHEEKVEAEIQCKLRPQPFMSAGLSINAGSINISNGVMDEFRMREFNQQQMAYRGSLNALRNGVEYSEIGLNSIQYKISDSNQEHLQQQPSIHHPLLGRDGGSIYQMNNAPMARKPYLNENFHKFIVIENDIELLTFDKTPGKLKKGERAQLIVMSGKTYLKQIEGSQKIYDATDTQYNPKKQPPVVIELDDD